MRIGKFGSMLAVSHLGEDFPRFRILEVGGGMHVEMRRGGGNGSGSNLVSD